VPGKATEAAAGRRIASWVISGPSRPFLQIGPSPCAKRIRRPLVNHPHNRKDDLSVALRQEQDCLAVEPLQFRCYPQELAAWEVECHDAVAADAVELAARPEPQSARFSEVN